MENKDGVLESIKYAGSDGKAISYAIIYFSDAIKEAVNKYVQSKK